MADSLKEIIEVKSSLDLIQDKEAYKSAMSAFAGKTKEHADILDTRSRSLIAFKNEYIKKQAQQLDIDLKTPQKDKTKGQ